MLADTDPAVIAAKEAIAEHERKCKELLEIAKARPTMANVKALHDEQDRTEQLITEYCAVKYPKE